MNFGKDFVFGVSTSSYQIEGNREGRGDSIWDYFCRTPGKVMFGHNGDVACDHVRRYKEDVGLIKQIKANAYRFSVSWPRVLKEGRGQVNGEGLDFYDKLTDELLENGIEPFMTLYHWDLPYELHKQGGWLNPLISDWFSEYTETVIRRLGDRVKNVITVNEPQCFVSLGYMKGVHAPGYKLSQKEILLIIHNVLLSHGKSLQTVKSCYSDVKVGAAMVANAHFPVDEKPENIAACRRAVMSLHGNYDNWVYNTPHWCDPIYLGTYPEESFREFGSDMPDIKAGDMEIISSPTDFHGENVYNGCAIADDGNGGYRVADFPIGFEKNSLGWAVTPKSLNYAVRFLYERYGKPIYITENGMCAHDWVSLDGKVHDSQRVDFMNRYLSELEKAKTAGADVRGYFAWSLMDNFEWAYGYSERFGLVYVDYSTQKRIMKDSAENYRKIIENNR